MTNEERIEKAGNYMQSGYNCAQAVTAAFADVYGIDEDFAIRLSTGFGGGIGCMRETCGAACGMFLLAGLEDGPDKKPVYDDIKILADKFKEMYGTLNCAELLGMKPSFTELTNKQIENRKKNCVQKVEDCAKIYAEFLKSKKQ